jgi:alpha/beta superfamily hydrolase
MLKTLLPAGFELLMIQGMGGVLEVCVSVPKALTPQTPLLLVSHPHPLHGGSLHNKVVQTVAKAGQSAGSLVVCFNFRGVGNSTGEFDHGHGERFDLKDVRAFALERWGERPIVMAGFSFGAWISALVAESLPPQSMILIAPPVSLYPMERLHIGDIPTTVIQGGVDEVTSAEQALLWAKQQSADVLWRAQASHYFHGQLLWLRRAIALGLGA